MYSFPFRFLTSLVIQGPAFGKGSSSQVFLIQRKVDKQTFIWKKLSNIDGQPPRFATTEINILKETYDSPFLVKMIEHLSTSDATYIIQEYCPDGSLRTKLDACAGSEFLTEARGLDDSVCYISLFTGTVSSFSVHCFVLCRNSAWSRFTACS